MFLCFRSLDHVVQKVGGINHYQPLLTNTHPSSTIINHDDHDHTRIISLFLTGDSEGNGIKLQALHGCLLWLPVAMDRLPSSPEKNNSKTNKGHMEMPTLFKGSIFLVILEEIFHPFNLCIYIYNLIIYISGP